MLPILYICTFLAVVLFKHGFIYRESLLLLLFFIIMMITYGIYLCMYLNYFVRKSELNFNLLGS